MAKQKGKDDFVPVFTTALEDAARLLDDVERGERIKSDQQVDIWQGRYMLRYMVSRQGFTNSSDFYQGEELGLYCPKRCAKCKACRTGLSEIEC